MCKLISGNQYSFISLKDRNGLFTISSEKKRNKELEDMFFEELNKKDPLLVSRENFDRLKQLIDCCNKIENISNSLASLVLANDNSKTTDIKREILKSAYSDFNEISKNLKL